MSQSPTGPLQRVNEDYIGGWGALSAMMREGLSFSGRERHCCFLNTGQQRFANISAVAGLDHLDDGRGVAVVDWDLDGALDLWISNRTGPRVRLMHNRSKTQNRFLQIELEGKTCNRDAIGARVELYTKDSPASPLIQTVRAGEGYVAQSSKRVHFGLGEGGVPDRVVVRWPGGESGEYRDLVGNGRYRILQGISTATLLPTSPSGTVQLAASEPNPPPVSDRARIVLLGRIPLPSLSYRTMDGKPASLNLAQPGPRLINLWASWCPPCVTELKDFTAHADQIRAQGVSVVALSVDEPQDHTAVASLLSTLSWPFDSGFAAEKLVGVFDTLQRAVLERSRPLPVPTSFLLDAQGRVAVIYKGPVRADILLSDVARLNDPIDQRRAAAAPFPGRWLGQPHRANLVSLAREFQWHGYPELALEYFSKGSAESNARVNLDDPTQQRDLANAQHELGKALHAQGQTEEGVAALKRAVEIDPTYWWAHEDLAVWLATAGEYDNACQHARAAADLNPGSTELNNQLATLLIARKQFDEAIEVLNQTSKLDAHNASTIFLLGAAYHYTGDPTAARRQYDRLQTLDPARAARLGAIIGVAD